MVDDIFISKFITELLPMASSAMDEQNLSNAFVDMIKKEFGLDNVELADIHSGNKNIEQLDDYISNTRKIYIDNQLSEFSAFPELINYKMKGFSSCAIIPVIGNGRVISSLRLLSKQENRFTQKMISTLEIASSFFAFSYIYKSEINKNNRLAEYFDIAFNAQYPQMLISKDNKIVKFNKEAIKEFDLNNDINQNIKNVLTFDFDYLKELKRDIELPLNTTRGLKIYNISIKKIGDTLIYLTVKDLTHKNNTGLILDSLLENNDIFLLITDDKFKIVKMSQNFEKLLGSGSIMGNTKSFLDISKLEQSFFKEIDPKKNKLIIAEFTMNTLNGVIPVKAYINKGAFGYGIVIINKIAEKYVIETQENINDFVNGSSDIIVIVDKSGYIQKYNMALEKVLGFDRTEIIGSTINRIYKEGDSELVYRDINYVKKGSKVDNTYINLVAKNSEIIPGTQSVRKLRGINEDDKFIIFIKELVTKQQLDLLKDEIKLKELEIKKYKAINELKTEFIHSMGHELRTPLTSIKGYSYLLANESVGKLNDTQKEYINIISAESDRFKLMIEQILEASKIDSDKIKLEFKEVDLKSLYNNASIKGLEEKAKQKGLAFYWNVDYDVPIINADPNRLIQVFVNLIGNAIKFTESGSITIHVKRQKRKYVECTVNDTGMGLSEDDKKKVFKKFYQVKRTDMTKKENEGTGLGLPITKGIISLHGGKMFIESQIGKGSTFGFIIPINKKQRKKQKEKEPENNNQA